MNVEEKARELAQIGMGYDFEGGGFRLDKRYIRIAKHVLIGELKARIEENNYLYYSANETTDRINQLEHQLKSLEDGK